MKGVDAFEKGTGHSMCPSRPRPRAVRYGSYIASGDCPSRRARGPVYAAGLANPTLETLMGKYVLGWFLGVPVIVLVVIYFFLH
jgi:hypothetical protein